jgi:hypothetical protein
MRNVTCSVLVICSALAAGGILAMVSPDDASALVRLADSMNTPPLAMSDLSGARLMKGGGP